MSTTAAVYIEAQDITIRVDSDGDPVIMLPALKRIIAEKLISTFASHREYLLLFESDEDYAEHAGYFSTRGYEAVAKLGFAFPSAEAIALPPLVSSGSQGYHRANEDYTYVITPEGTIEQPGVYRARRG